MKTKLFNGKLYRQSLRRIRLPALLMTGSVVLLHLVYLLYLDSSYYDSRRAEMLYNEALMYDANLAMRAPAALLLLLFGPILMLLLFRFLTKREEADFYHSLPVSRPCLYFTLTAAALTYIWGALLVVYSLSALFCGFFYTPFLKYIFRLFVWYLVASLVTVSFAGVAVSVTGTTLSAFLVGTMLCFGFRFLAANIVSTLHIIVPALSLGNGQLAFFQPTFFLPIRLLFFDQSFLWQSNVGCVLYSLAVGVIFLALGCLLFARRPSEQATRPAPSGALQAFYRIAASLPFAMLSLSSLLCSHFAAYSVYPQAGIPTSFTVYALLAVFVYFLYQLVTERRRGSFVKALVQFPILLAVCGVIAGTCLLVRHSVLTLRPAEGEIIKVEIMEKVEPNNGNVFFSSLSTQLVSYRADFSSFEWEDSLPLTSTDRGVCEFVRQKLNATLRADEKGRGKAHSHVYRITLRDGRTITRQICDNDEENRLRLLLSLDEDHTKEFLRLPDKADVSAAHLQTGSGNHYVVWQSGLVDAFYEEYNALSDDEKREVKFGGATAALSLTLYLNTSDASNECTCAIPASFEKTQKLYREQYLETHIIS